MAVNVGSELVEPRRIGLDVGWVSFGALERDVAHEWSGEINLSRERAPSVLDRVSHPARFTYRPSSLELEWVQVRHGRAGG